jgi:hypothetical protein
MNWLKDKGPSVVVFSLLIGVIFYFAVSSQPNRSDNDVSDYNSENSGEIQNSHSDYDTGYDWATEHDTENFRDCQNEFGTGDSEDGCNEYVKENHTGYQSFKGYECTEDCSGHEAGYNWAEENGIEDAGDCRGNSQSFIEGCISYVEETQ